MSGLREILAHPGIWQGRNHHFHHARDKAATGLATGFPMLDAQLPDGGWPRGALTEILFDHPGQGEFRLLLPALREITRQQHYVAMIAPPWIPYAPALFSAGIDLRWLFLITPEKQDDHLWALEQALRAGHCRAVLAWPTPDIPLKTLRRLQLAAEAGNASGFLLRHSNTRRQHSPAALRLLLTPPNRVEIIKCRGRNAGGSITLKQLATPPH